MIPYAQHNNEQGNDKQGSTVKHLAFGKIKGHHRSVA